MSAAGLLLFLVVLGIIDAQGRVWDWLSVHRPRVHDALPTLGAVGFACFAGSLFVLALMASLSG